MRSRCPLLLLTGCAAAAALPSLEQLGSDWVPFGTGATVPTKLGPEPIPIDCPSISNTAGSVGSCEPGCADVLSFNSWTAGAYLQGTCSTRVRLGGVAVNVTRHRWLPHEVTREGTAGAHTVVSSMRLLDDGAGTPGILLNLTVTAGQAAEWQGQGSGAELELSFAPEVQLLADMPWNINWPPPKAGWDHTVKASSTASQQLLLSSDTTTSAVTALGVSVSGGAPLKLVAPTERSVGLGAHGPSATARMALTARRTTLTVRLPQLKIFHFFVHSALAFAPTNGVM